MQKRLLTDDQIAEGKQLREEGWTKDRLALKYNVAPTTIWQNIYATDKRHKLYTPVSLCCYFCDKPLKKHPRCESCSILLHDDIIEGEPNERLRCSCGLAHTARVGNLCVNCTLKKMGEQPLHTTYLHTHEELSRNFGESKGQIAKQEHQIGVKIVKSPKFVHALSETGKHQRYALTKLKRAEETLESIPAQFFGEHGEDMKNLIIAWKKFVEEMG